GKRIGMRTQQCGTQPLVLTKRHSLGSPAFPFNIQAGLNGLEWLTRQMNQPGLKYRQQGNCFVWIEDYEEAQKLMHRQLEINWTELLKGFAGQLNPVHETLFAGYPVSYYWTCYQSDRATDISMSQG